MLGTPSFLLIYFGSLIAGSLYALQHHKNEPYYSAVGASGAVTGIVYASILLYPEMELYLFFVPIPIPGYIFGIGYLLYSIYGMKRASGKCGAFLHIWEERWAAFALTLLVAPELFSTHTFVVGCVGSSNRFIAAFWGSLKRACSTPIRTFLNEEFE